MSGDYLPERITYIFTPETPRLARNRARLAAIIAQKKPAIEAPRRRRRIAAGQLELAI